MNNRELASLFLTVLFVLFAVIVNRTSAWNVVKSFLSLCAGLIKMKVLWLLLCTVGGYIAVELWLASLLGLWDVKLTKDTVVCLIGISPMIWKCVRYFRSDAYSPLRLLCSLFTVSALCSVYMNAFVLSFWLEVLLQFGLFSVYLLLSFAQRLPGCEDVIRILKTLLGIVGLIMFLYVTCNMITQWRQMIDGITSMVLPIWLTLGVAPVLSAVRFIQRTSFGSRLLTKI